MKLVDMKYTASEKKEEVKEMKEWTGPEYPYCTNMCLDGDVLDKLGIKDLPEVGAVMQITAEAKVVSVRQSAREGGDDSRSIELQITKMGVGAKGTEKKKKTAAEVMYGDE